MIARLISASVVWIGLLAATAFAQESPGMTMEICPNDYNSFPMDTPPLTCGCSAEQAKADDTIWGANPYAAISSICRGAVHAGAIAPGGGQVVVTPAGDVPVFPSVTRNGIESGSSGKGDGFTVAPIGGASAAAGTGGNGAAATSGAPAKDGAAAVGVNICPNDYSSFPSDSPDFTCTCSPELARDGGTIWGANPYAAISSICRGAVQAGAIGLTGGDVKVSPVAAVPVFPGITRNGVESGSAGKGDGFKVASSTGSVVTTVVTEATGISLDVCPNTYSSFPMDSPVLSCTCSPELARDGGTIWGANPYATISSICRGAVQAGAIGLTGGDVKVSPVAAVPVFPGITRNGVESGSSGKGDGFKVASSTGSVVTTVVTEATGISLDVCPNTYSSFPMDSPVLSCTCSPELARDGGTIWGANPYATISSICRGAVQAGAIGLTGGDVKVSPVAAVPVFPGITRNGVESGSSGKGDGFTVAAASGTPVVTATPADAAGITMDVCPNDYSSFPMDTPPLTCTCSPELARDGGTIWGANPYASISSLCRGAVQSGAIDLSGGQITVVPAAGVAVFPSITKNAVESGSSGKGDGFTVKVGAARKPAVDAAGVPIQAPIAATLEETGRVQLYINFATDKAEPLPGSAPVLAELLSVMRDKKDLKLQLIGHTDSQGGADYNMDLSQRRAASVYLFLVQSGIQPDRLSATGHGLTEPIADNNSLDGRALNRRVEARQM